RLENAVSGFLLQVNTRQLNLEAENLGRGASANQLLGLSGRGLFDPPLREAQLAELPRLAAIGNTNASLELRVRSYLDANCAFCHRPGGPSRGVFDARFSTPLAQQGLINGELAGGDLGIAGARMVAPGEPAKSILYQRLKRTDFFRMPPVAVNDAP